jgi:site-specific recombinase XerD
MINVRKAFAYAIKKAKITKAGITAHHHARHSAATIAAGETMDVLALQALGRWRSLRMVERYTHPKAERARSVISKL